MVYPKGYRLLCQAMLDTILKYCYHPFYLPVGCTFDNGDMVMDNTRPFTEMCKAARKLGTIICPDVAWLALTGNQVIIQELGGPPTMQRGHSMGVHSLREWIHGDKEVTISIFIPWKWTRHVDAPSNEWCATFVHPV